MGTNTQHNTITQQRPNPAELLTIFNITEDEATHLRVEYLINQLTTLQDKAQALIDKTPDGRLKKIKHQIKHLRLQIEDLTHRKGIYLSLKIKYNDDFFRDYITDQMNQLQEEADRLTRRLKYLKNSIKPVNPNSPAPRYPKIDIEQIKEQVKIRTILEAHGINIIHNNFFAIRNEKTPSCQFNEKKNVYSDYGNGNKGGSVIDLYMTLNNCSIFEAIKSLNIYL